MSTYFTGFSRRPSVANERIGPSGAAQPRGRIVFLFLIFFIPPLLQSSTPRIFLRHRGSARSPHLVLLSSASSSPLRVPETRCYLWAVGCEFAGARSARSTSRQDEIDSCRLRRWGSTSISLSLSPYIHLWPFRETYIPSRSFSRQVTHLAGKETILGERI